MVKKDYYMIIRARYLSKETKCEIADKIEEILDYDDFRVYFDHKNVVALLKAEELPAVLEIVRKYKVNCVVKRYKR